MPNGTVRMDQALMATNLKMEKIMNNDEFEFNAAVCGEAVARLMYWRGPSHYAVPHGGICARTYAEFSKGAGENGGYWEEGEELFTVSSLSARAASAHYEPSELLYTAVMNIPCERTMSHFVTLAELRAYKEGHHAARHAAVNLVAAFKSRAADAPSEPSERLNLLEEFYCASTAWENTCGHPDATADDERKAEERFIAAGKAMRTMPVKSRAADAPSEPSEKKAVAWIDQFGNVFPLGAYQPSGKPSYLDADKRGWKPLFRAADALDSQPTFRPWQKLWDSQWVNIVNHDQGYESMDKVDAVHLAVKMTEDRLKLNNTEASSQPTDGTPAQQLYRFKRFHKGVLMADGIGVHATTMDDAIERAQKLMDRGDTIEFESNRPCVRKCGICQPTDGGVRNG